MSFVATAIIGSAVIGAGTSIIGAKSASKAAQEGTDKALDAQWQMYQQSRDDFAPWRKAGEGALGALQGMMDAGPGDFNPEEQPGYKFGFQEFIQKPYENQQGARGKRLSGETLKELSDRAMQYGNTQYGSFLDRYYQSLQPFTNLSQQGQAAAAGQAGIAQQAGTNAGNLQYQNAINQGDIATGMGSGIAGAAQKGAQSWQDYKSLLPTVAPMPGSGGTGFAGWEGPT